MDEKIFEKFSKVNIVVIGDIMLDRYLEGKTTRISAEAPVPIVEIEREHFELGGAGNVAANVSNLGAGTTLLGFLGEDREGEIIRNLLQEKKIRYILGGCKKSTVKNRIVSKGQQLLRYDSEDKDDKFFSETTQKMLLELCLRADFIIISDYAKGTVHGKLMELLAPYRKKILVDPRPAHTELYKNVFLITPNEKEAYAMSSLKDTLLAGRNLQERLHTQVLITRGEKGMALYGEKEMEIPTYAREVYDVTGAGDTVVATLGVALAAGASLEEAAVLANHAAGISVEKKGTYAVSKQELELKLKGELKKVVERDQLYEIIKNEKRKGKRIVWTNGCFDILHVGHIKLLEESKKLGDILIVGLNSDSSVQQLKGVGRPLTHEKERAEIISSLHCVDYVCIYPDLDAVSLLQHLQPDYYVKGKGHTLDSIHPAEREVLEICKGEIKFITGHTGVNSHDLVEKVRGLK